MKRCFTIFLMIFIHGAVFASNFTPNGQSDRYTDLLNPGQTFSGAGVLRDGSLTDTFVNPAVQAFQQRFAFDINYAGIVGHTDGHSENGYPGHAVTLGAGLPSPIGYFTLTGGFYHSSWDDFALGSQGFFNVALGKKVYDELYLGLGLKSVVGGLTGNAIDYLVAADLGIVHRPGDVGRVSDFRWGLALQNLGWGTMTPFSSAVNNGTLLAPDLFSLQAGLSFSVVKTERFNLGFESEIFLPSFTNFEAAAGFLFEFERLFAFSVSSRVNALQLRDGDYSSLLPSFGFVCRYIPKARDAASLDDLTEVHVKAASGAMQGTGLWSYQTGVTVFLGGEDTFAPEIQFEIQNENSETNSFFYESDTQTAPAVRDGEAAVPVAAAYEKDRPAREIPIAVRNRKSEETVEKTKQETGTDASEPKISHTKTVSVPPYTEDPQPVYYVSPNFDGIQDSLKISLNLQDTRLIKSYSLTIENENREIVRKIQNKEQRDENRGRDFFKNLFRPYKGIFVPSEIIWDCTSDSGEIVSDGLYSFYLTAADENDNISVSPRVYFAVDTVYPQVDFIYETDDLIFSPNQDGNKDFLTVTQTSSEEVLWKTYIENSFIGTVDKKNYKGKLPDKLVWGGKNQSGIPVPDGTYRYRVEAVDKAGNRTEKVLDGIILNTEQTPIQLFTDSTAISPKSETGNPFLTLTPDLAVKDDIVEWKIRIINAEGNSVKELTGTGVMEGFVFDGLNENGEPYSDGIYTAQLDVTYRNGNRPQSVTPEFRIDTVPPSAEVSIPDPIFSPDQDGQKDRIQIRQKGSPEDEWTAEVTDAEGKTVFTQTWYGELPESFLFDGYDQDSRVLPDGTYTYRLVSTDRAGNSGGSNAVSFTVDTRKSSVSLKTGYAAFSPNGDGIKETVELIPEIENQGNLDSYQLTVLDASDRVVREYPNSGYILPRYEFDGKNKNGKVLPDGEYRFRLNAVFANGQNVTTISRPVKLKTTYPQAELEYDNLWFSPNGDGLRDTIGWKQKSSAEDLWEGVIKNSSGKEVRTFKTTGTLSDFEWDGKNNQGNLLPDGVYSYELEAVDEAGNSFCTVIPDIHLDRSPTLISIAVSSRGISPNGDGRVDTMTLKPTVSNKKGIKNWEMTLTHQNGLKKTYSGEGDSVPESIVWNGLADGDTLTEGTYRLLFTVEYFKGDRPETVIENLVVDVTPPVLNVGLSPLPFSPDNDNINDELSIEIGFDDISDIEKWQFAVYDPKNNPFKKFEGRGKKVNLIRWDGRSYKGDTVFSAEDYPYRFMAADQWGNFSEVSGVIPVDILVVRDGDRLKIQIANINFAPNSAALTIGDPDLVQKNRSILRRLAQTLKKYKTYQVQVEGHANAVLWYNAVQAKKEEEQDLYPLSLARAETIVAELVKEGVDPQRLTAVGKGGTNPVIDPEKDTELWKQENWKNRRVEFILEK